MIASVTYHVNGNEEIVGGFKKIPFFPTSGLNILDIIINGVSIPFNDITLSEEFGYILTGEPLDKGDFVICIYKTLPVLDNSVIPVDPAPMVDFVETEFLEGDFL